MRRTSLLAEKEGFQSLSFEMGARDDRRSGNPRCRSVLLRIAASCPSPWPAAAGERRGAGRARGGASGDGDLLRPAVPWLGREGVAGFLPAAAVAVAVQPQAAGVESAAGVGAAAALGAARDRLAQARGRHP